MNSLIGIVYLIFIYSKIIFSVYDLYLIQIFLFLIWDFRLSIYSIEVVYDDMYLHFESSWYRLLRTVLWVWRYEILRFLWSIFWYLSSLQLFDDRVYIMKFDLEKIRDKYWAQYLKELSYSSTTGSRLSFFSSDKIESISISIRVCCISYRRLRWENRFQNWTQ